MSENIFIDKNLSKEEKYKSLIPQIKSLITGEEDFIANLANVSSALYFGMNYFWVGFYLVKNEQLVLGPFHGPIACTRINLGNGVCGTSWQQKQTIIVPDVDKFPGHIACSSDSKSEIVIPGIIKGEVIFVLDVDSENLNSYDETDKKYLEELVNFITQTKK
jgi:GAF domain-containing protein